MSEEISSVDHDSEYEIQIATACRQICILNNGLSGDEGITWIPRGTITGHNAERMLNDAFFTAFDTTIASTCSKIDLDKLTVYHGNGSGWPVLRLVANH